MKKKPIILEVDRGKQLNFILLRYTYVDINDDDGLMVWLKFVDV